MSRERLFERYMESLLAGDRRVCRSLIQEALDEGIDARTIYHDVIWSAMQQVETFYRADRINLAVEHMATRVNRCVVDRLQAALVPKELNGKKILVACADDETQELGGQVLSDLFEADGWVVNFVGGGVANDEMLMLVGQVQPDILLVYGSEPQGVPEVRKLIDLVRDVGPHPTMNVMISGGVFNRAEGLWEEIQADLFAPTAKEALEVAAKAEPRVPTPRVPGAPKKRRRRRRPPLLAQAEAS